VQETITPPKAAGTSTSSLRKRLAWAALILLVLGLGAYGVKVGRWHVFPRRFKAIEPGLYRSAQLERGPYERVVEENGIRSVLRLYVDPQPRLGRIEDDVVAGHRLEFLTVHMPGTGLADFESIDRAADIVAEKSRWPILFHCASGDRRSSTVQAAYRMKHCGWTWEKTAEELERFGLDREDGDELYRHLERYSREHLKKSGGSGK
jgi:Tyrosine phosphatase family